MRVAYAISVADAQWSPNGTLAAQGMESTVFTAPALPSPVPVQLVILLETPPHLVGEAHDLVIEVTDPGLQTVARVAEPILARPGPGLPEGSDIRTLLAPMIMFDATLAGYYSINVSYGGSAAYTTNITVRGA